MELIERPTALRSISLSELKMVLRYEKRHNVILDGEGILKLVEEAKYMRKTKKCGDR